MKISNLKNSEGKVLLCVPIMGVTQKDIIDDVVMAMKNRADAIEWRVDFYNDVKEIDKVLDTLKKIREILVDARLVFTYRSVQEGGSGDITSAEYLLLLKTAMLSKLIDIVDVELLLGDTIINAIVKHAQMAQVLVLISNHDIDSTPRYDVIGSRINVMYAKGGDIAKVAYTPKSEEDVNVLYDVAKGIQSERPYILISMGERGARTRIDAEKLGSCLSFVSLPGKASAPGQIDIIEWRKNNN